MRRIEVGYAPYCSSYSLIWQKTSVHVELYPVLQWGLEYYSMMRTVNIDSPFECWGRERAPQPPETLADRKGAGACYSSLCGYALELSQGKRVHLEKSLTPLAFWGFLIPEPGLQCGREGEPLGADLGP